MINSAVFFYSKLFNRTENTSLLERLLDYETNGFIACKKCGQVNVLQVFLIDLQSCVFTWNCLVTKADVLMHFRGTVKHFRKYPLISVMYREK